MSKNKFFLGFAEYVAEQSRAKRLKVGAVIVKDDNILGYGFNGTPAGRPNECEDLKGNTKPEVLHAEMNALMKVSRTTQSCEGATIYTTERPCMNCAKLIVASGIQKVVYRHNRKDDDEPLHFLSDCGVFVERTFGGSY